MHIEILKDQPTELDEGERQMIILALAILSVMRPGYGFSIDEIAAKFHGEPMLREFQKFNVGLNATPWKTPPDAKLYHKGTLTLPGLRELAGLEPRPSPPMVPPHGPQDQEIGRKS